MGPVLKAKSQTPSWFSLFEGFPSKSAPSECPLFISWSLATPGKSGDKNKQLAHVALVLEPSCSCVLNHNNKRIRINKSMTGVLASHVAWPILQFFPWKAEEQGA